MTIFYNLSFFSCLQTRSSNTYFEFSVMIYWSFPTCSYFSTLVFISCYCFVSIADLGSSFWGMVFILSSTHLLATRIAAGCFILALIIVLFVAKNWFLRWLCIGFIIFIAVVWVIQEFTTFHVLKYVILFIGVMNSLFSVYDIYDDTISRRVNSSDAEKFAEICPCPCNGVGWGVIWGFISFIFLCASIYLGLVILS